MQQSRGLLRWLKASTCVRPLDRHDALWNHPDRQVTAKPVTNMSKQTNWPWLESNSYRLDSGLQLVVLADALTIWANRPASLTTVHGVCVSSFTPGFNCWFSSAPVVLFDTPGISRCRNTFLSSPHLCFIIVFICDLFVSRDDPLMS